MEGIMYFGQSGGGDFEVEVVGVVFFEEQCGLQYLYYELMVGGYVGFVQYMVDFVVQSCWQYFFGYDFSVLWGVQWVMCNVEGVCVMSGVNVCV